jgi:hypothetical protein
MTQHNFFEQAIVKMFTEQNDFRKKYYDNNLDNQKGVMQPTSLEALKSIDCMSIMEKVLCELKILQSTDDELEQRMGMRHQTVSSCRRKCVIKEWVVPTGKKRPTRSGRNANVWELTDEGKAKVKTILERKEQ